MELGCGRNKIKLESSQISNLETSARCRGIIWEFIQSKNNSK